MVENEMDSKIKCLRSNNGEFNSKEFMDYCNSHGIKRKFSIARTPLFMARTMLMDSKLTNIFWTQAVHTTVHIQNRVMLRNNNEKTSYELWKGSIDNNLYIKVIQGNILLIEIYVDDIVLEVLMTC